MKIITTTGVFPKEVDALDILPRLAKIGYDGFDLSFSYEFEYSESRFNREALDWVKQVRETLDELGLTMHHSHAPFDASARGALVEKVMQSCQILGIQYTVVHPIWRREDMTIIDNVDEFIEVNEKGMQNILPAAEAYGVKALTENLLWGASIAPKNMDTLVEAVNSPYFGWCFDVGHAHAFHHEPAELIGLRHVPDMFHIHDNHGTEWDEHLMPGDGTVDWADFAKVMKEIGYQGDFTLEAHHQTLAAPDEHRDQILQEMLIRSRQIIDLFQSL